MKKQHRTTYDFSKHELIVSENDLVSIYWLKKPDSLYSHSVKFINSCGVLAVTGDYGNWIFCREFHPGKDGFVSDGYWKEKLRINSIQESDIYDPVGTEKQIHYEIKKGLKEYGYEGQELKNIKEFYKDVLLEAVEDEQVYLDKAYNEAPRGFDTECTPHIKKTQPRLNYIFDAFDEICSRY
jgi:hypothetical protein